MRCPGATVYTGVYVPNKEGTLGPRVGGEVNSWDIIFFRLKIQRLWLDGSLDELTMLLRL
jgi:hypothetical protein